MFHTVHHQAPLDEWTLTQIDELGLIVGQADNVNGGFKLYRYMKVLDLTASVTIQDGSVVAFADVSGFSKTNCTPDIAGGSAFTNLPFAGVVSNSAGATLGSASVATAFGYVQIKGYHANVLTDGNVTEGISVEVGAADGVCAPVSVTYTPQHPVQYIGLALADDAGSPTTSPVLIEGAFQS